VSDAQNALVSRLTRIVRWLAVAALVVASAGAASAHGRWPHHHHHGHWRWGLSAGIGFGGYWPYGGYWVPGAVWVVPAGDDPWRTEDAAPAVAPPSPDPVFVPRAGARDPTRAEADWRECSGLAFGQPAARADAQVFHRSVLACMDERGYVVR
jgi:hypothetical protein